ncbi:MAG: divalent-cation tolerance protein CutA [Microthrixaceae bacterium]|nr:divalent-cation tolerance protein CutA [Microthrixaceae bacterium]
MSNHEDDDRGGTPAAALVVTVVDDRGVAERLARSAVESRLAACAQLEGPVLSTYRWKGQLCSDQEWRVVAKSTVQASANLVDAWAAAHPYEVPEILVQPVLGGHRPYLDWLATEVADRPGR